MLILGGGLLAAGSFLDLGTAWGPSYREAIRAVGTFEGGAFSAAGAALVVAGLVAWAPGVARVGRLIGVAAMLGGGALLWLAVSGALSVGREAGRLGEGVEVSLGMGLYLAMAGAALALIGGSLSLFAPRDRPRDREPDAGRHEGWAAPAPEVRAPNGEDEGSRSEREVRYEPPTEPEGPEAAEG